MVSSYPFFNMLPLSGLKVLDFSTSFPGPMATLLCAEAGAQVIKIEKPGDGEPLRYESELWGHSSPTFSMLNRGKLSLALDLKDRHQIKWLEPLLKESDILLERFRPGVMERLGLGYEAVHRLNPRLIYCSITGYGQTGPKADTPGHDLTYMADTGLLSLSPGEPRYPTLPPVLVSSFAGGAYPAFLNILLALFQRQKTGHGMHLDISITDNLFALASWAIAQGLTGEDWPKPGKEKFTGGSARYQVYPTQDGRLLAVACLEPAFWKAFCEALLLPQTLQDETLDKKTAYSLVRKAISQKTSEELKVLFEPLKCCCTLVATLEEAMKDPHYHARGIFEHTLENEYGDTLPAISVPLCPQFRKDPEPSISAPALGGHNDMLLKKN